MQKEVWKAIFTYVGIIVGAGILGLPYVMAKYGFLTGLLAILLVLFIMIPSALIIGEISQRTKGRHQLTGLVEKYLGKKAKWFMFVIIMLGIYAALIAYCIGAGQIFTDLFGGNSIYYSLSFWFIFSLFLYFKLKMIAKVEMILNPLKLIFIFILGVFTLTLIDLNNLASFDLTKVMMPIGVILFALSGISAIPIMNEELKDKRLLKPAILIGLAIATIVYVIFSAALVGIMGINTPEVSTIGLASLGLGILLLVNLFAVLSIATAYTALGYALKEGFVYDLKIKNKLAWLLVVIIPLVFILLQFHQFVSILGISGAIGTGLAICMLLLTHSKAQQHSELKPSYIVNLPWFFKILIVIIVLAAVYLEVVAII